MADVSTQEQSYYDRFRKAYEEHEKRVWELEKITTRLLAAKKEGRKEPEREVLRDAASKQVGEALQVLQVIVAESKEALGSPADFMGEAVSADGLAATMRHRTEREALENPNPDFPYTFRTALLNAFLDREKQSRASIYKKKVRSGFKTSAEKLIAEEQQKNEIYRKQLVEQHPELLSPADVELFDNAFKRRMARHGEDAL